MLELSFYMTNMYSLSNFDELSSVFLSYLLFNAILDRECSPCGVFKRY